MPAGLELFAYCKPEKNEHKQCHIFYHCEGLQIVRHFPCCGKPGHFYVTETGDRPQIPQRIQLTMLDMPH